MEEFRLLLDFRALSQDPKRRAALRDELKALLKKFADNNGVRIVPPADADDCDCPASNNVMTTDWNSTRWPVDEFDDSD